MADLVRRVVALREATEVALSRDEQRLLDQIEHGLETEDPELTREFRASGRGPHHFLGIVTLICGAGLVLLGLTLANDFGTAVAVVGFITMIVGCQLGVRAIHHAYRAVRERSSP